jgi:NADH:ubiquinone oxidoreductase subunit 3 (subunit A)
MFNASINGMLACYFFLIILTVGFLYELSKGVLDLE